jgi:two-component system nitrate/nitrite sensor histidine kinase NarX
MRFTGTIRATTGPAQSPDAVKGAALARPVESATSARTMEGATAARGVARGEDPLAEGPADLRHTLEDFLGTVVRLAGARAGAVRSSTPDGGQMRLVAAVGLSPRACESEALVGACGVCGDAFRGRDVSVTDTAARCDRLAAGAAADGYTGTVAVPLLFRGATVGVFTLFFDSVNTLRAEVLHLLRPLGELLGLTIENTRLERARREASLAHERQVIAGEIHDSLAQSLTFVRMRMPLLQDAIAQHEPLRARRYCAEVDDEIASANGRLRELITHFRAGMHAHGLQHALQQVAETFPARTGIGLTLENSLPPTHLPLEKEVQVFHVIQEALANVFKHSGASQARIVLAPSDAGIVVTVEDNGIGLPHEVARSLHPDSPSTHFGLQIMQERAVAIGADIDIECPPTGGTCVRLSLPPAASLAKAIHD